MNQRDESRHNRQLLGADKWKAAGGNGTLEYATGVGKTYVATNIIIPKMIAVDPFRTFLIVVPGIPLKDQWEERLKEEGLLDHCDVKTIKSIILDGEELTYHVLVLDEIHKYAADRFRDVFKLIRRKHTLGLTASLERMDLKHLVLIKECPVVDRITAEEAKKNGWIADYREFALGIEMDDLERTQYEALNTSFYKYFGKFQQDFTLAMSCMNIKNAEKYAIEMGWDPSLGDNHIWSPKMVKVYALQFNKAMQRRKLFLYEFPKKYDLVKDIFDRTLFKKNKTVCFSQSTIFAYNLAEMLKARCYFSKLKPPKDRKISATKFKKETIERFKEGKDHFLCAAKALDEGLDVPDIEMAIVTSYTSNPTQKIQRRGRATRKFTLKDGKEKKPIIVYFYVKETQEERWLKNSLRNSTNIMFIDNVNDIFRKTKITLTGEKLDFD